MVLAAFTAINRGLKRDVLFCYDLQLPPDFRPQPQAGSMFKCIVSDFGYCFNCMSAYFRCLHNRNKCPHI